MGRDFDKIKEACAKYEGPLPEYDIKKSGIMVLCKTCDRYMKLLENDKLKMTLPDKPKSKNKNIILSKKS